MVKKEKKCSNKREVSDIVRTRFIKFEKEEKKLTEKFNKAISGLSLVL